MIRRATLAILLALAAGAVRGQDETAPGAERPARAEAFKMVDAYVISNLQESLGLTDDQLAKAIPLVTKLQTERREHLLERTRKVREMRRLLRQGGASEAQVVELLREVQRLEQEGTDTTRRNAAALDAVLTPIQQAKFRVMELEVEQRMRELVRRAGPRRGTRSPQE